MISTITATTIELLSTTTSAIDLLAIATLIILLIQHEIASGMTDSRTRRLCGALAAPIVLLVIVFLAILVLKLAAFWG